jgi:hypothetical protein
LASSSGALFAVFAHCLASFWIDEMQHSARETRNAHKNIAGPPGLFVVRNPALHVETRVGAAIDERRHRVLLDGVQPACVAPYQMRPAQRHTARFDLGAGGANPASREFDGLDLLGESGLGGEEAETIPAGERATTRIPILCDGRIC